MTKLSLPQGIQACMDGQIFGKTQRSVIFVGSKYQQIFFAKWRSLVGQKFNLKFESLDSSEEQSPQILNHSWLQQAAKKCLWLGEVTSIKQIPEDKNNHLFFFCTEQKLELMGSALKPREVIRIKIPNMISPQTMAEIFQALGYKLSGPRLDAWKNILKNAGNTVSLDFALELSNYFGLTSAAHIKNLPSYLESLTPTEQRFFWLPDLLFSGQWGEFFKIWDKVKDEFPSQFWISFWTNVFYKACATKISEPGTNQALTKSLFRASKTGFFQRLTLEKLKKCMLRIYKSDHDLKKGFGTGQIECILFELI